MKTLHASLFLIMPRKNKAQPGRKLLRAPAQIIIPSAWC
jgi:hypothetical protein